MRLSLTNTNTNTPILHIHHFTGLPSRTNFDRLEVQEANGYFDFSESFILREEYFLHPIQIDKGFGF
jgi:hypothetical protein